MAAGKYVFWANSQKTKYLIVTSLSRNKRRMGEFRRFVSRGSFFPGFSHSLSAILFILQMQLLSTTALGTPTTMTNGRSKQLCRRFSHEYFGDNPMGTVAQVSSKFSMGGTKPKIIMQLSEWLFISPSICAVTSFSPSFP